MRVRDLGTSQGEGCGGWWCSRTLPGQGQACKGSCKHLPGNCPCPCPGLGASMHSIPFPLLQQSVSSRVTMETPLFLRPSPASLWFLSAAEAGRDSSPALADSGPTSDLALPGDGVTGFLAPGMLPELHPCYRGPAAHLHPTVYGEHSVCH